MRLTCHARRSQGRIPPEKLVIGIPAYARHAKDLSDVKSYADIIDLMLKDGFPAKDKVDQNAPLVEKLDPAFKSRNEYESYLFDCVLSAQRKTAWAKSMGLAGVFIWEIGQDKVEPHVSLTEGVMLVGNGTRTLTRAELVQSFGTDKNTRPPLTAADLGSVKERRRRKREEAKKASKHVEL